MAPARNQHALVILTVSVLTGCVPALVDAANAQLEFTIREEEAVDSQVGSLGDENLLPLRLEPGLRGSLRYSLLPQGFPRSTLFRVDELTGQIYTRQRIDRESICGSDHKCDLDLQVAVQSAISQYFQKVKIVIRVLDINDNAPTFPRPIKHIRILENVAIGSSFPLEEATDLDTGDFGVRGYEIFPHSSLFNISVTKGEGRRKSVTLVVRQQLDRETNPTHDLIIVAHDGGQPPKTGSVSILVSVDDVNDNAPLFDHAVYNVSLPETAAVGVLVTSVSATDLDTEDFGVREYQFSPLERDDVSRYFAINSSTGQIFVAGSLLEKQGETFRLHVECLDKGFPPLVSRTEVAVTVKDTVNSAPTVNLNTLFGGSVSELAQSGTVVALLGVIDRDAGHNGVVTCSVVSDAFELQTLSANEYKVIVVRALDRELEPVIDISVTCQDAGSPPLSDSVKFSVKVKDENDNAPHFTQPSYQKSVAENNMPGQILLRVTAEDKDAGENAKISYELTGTKDLRIDTRGNVIAVGSLDHEKIQQLKFKVVATDNGLERRSATAEVVIDVVDINDEPPVFEKAVYEFEVLENLPANTSINSVAARDKDSGEYGRVIYAVRGTEGPFEVLSNGVIVTTESLDREQREVYKLTVYAADNGHPALTSSVTVVITVADQNDHAPRIVYPKGGNSSVLVAFDTKVGSVVLSVLTEDEDSGTNRELEYHLASGIGLSMFEIDKRKGDLILARALTPNDAGKHRLTVVVTDLSPANPLVSNASFEITIFAPNHTEPTAHDREKEHVLVVIILGVITGVVTVAVVFTIAIIRRSDLQRRKYEQNRHNKMAQDADKEAAGKSSATYGVKRNVSTASKTKENKAKRNEANDWVEEDSNKLVNNSQNATLPAESSEWSQSMAMHPDFFRVPGMNNMRNPSDDVTSDVSGESNTCDSGRGGSDDDNGSHGRQSPLHGDSTPRQGGLEPRRSSQQVSGPPMANFAGTSHAPLHHPQALLLRHGHISRERASPSPLPSPMVNQLPVKHVSFREDFPPDLYHLLTPQGGRKLDRLPSHHLRGLEELKLILDRSYETPDDGNSTTTSGSYTVEELSPRMMGMAHYHVDQAVV